MRWGNGGVRADFEEDFTLTVYERWNLCFALDAYIWRKVEDSFQEVEWAHQRLVKGDDEKAQQYFDITLGGKTATLQRYVDLYYRLTAWEESEGATYGEDDPIWMSSWNDRIAEMMTRGPDWYEDFA